MYLLAGRHVLQASGAALQASGRGRPRGHCAAMRVGTQGGPRPFWDLAVVEVAASTWLWASGTGRPPSDRVAAGAGVMQALLTTRPPGQHAAGDAPLGLSDVGVMEPAGARRDGGSDLATVGRSHAPAPALHHSPRSGMITSERPLLSFAAHLVSRAGVGGWHAFRCVGFLLVSGHAWRTGLVLVVW